MEATKVAAHTPGPWRTFETAYGAVQIVKRASDSHMADILVINTERNANAAADCEFIVRACNAHDDLLAALVEAERVVALHLPNAAGSLRVIRAAIAKAQP